MPRRSRTLAPEQTTAAMFYRAPDLAFHHHVRGSTPPAGPGVTRWTVCRRLLDVRPRTVAARLPCCPRCSAELPAPCPDTPPRPSC